MTETVRWRNELCKVTYDFADLILEECKNRVLQTTIAEPIPPEGDLFKPRLVFIGSDGKCQSKKSSNLLFEEVDGPVVVVLPQYRRMFVLEVKSAKDWNDANEVAAKCNVLAFADWYLPSVKELELLVCRDRMSPATYPALIKHTPFHDWYWSRDPHPSDSSFAFRVSLSSGSVYWNYRSNSGLVRACREVSANELSALGL